MANKNIQRIGFGGRLVDDVYQDNSPAKPGIFTFDSVDVTFDSEVDTFDFDIIPIVPVEVKDYSTDYSSDYK